MRQWCRNGRDMMPSTFLSTTMACTYLPLGRKRVNKKGRLQFLNWVSYTNMLWLLQTKQWVALHYDIHVVGSSDGAYFFPIGGASFAWVSFQAIGPKVQLNLHIFIIFELISKHKLLGTIMSNIAAESAQCKLETIDATTLHKWSTNQIFNLGLMG